MFEFLDEEELTPESTKDARITEVHGRVTFEHVKIWI